MDRPLSAPSDPEEQAPLVLFPPDHQVAWEWLAVLGAANIPGYLQYRGRSPRIVVPPEFAERARAELDTYREESRDWPPAWSLPPSEPEHFSIFGALIGVALMYVFMLTGEFDPRNSWFARGAASSELLLRGEWWRCITALCLHADFPHVAGNAICCALIGPSVSRRLGDGAAWFLILVAGILGNVLTAWLYQHGHLSVGASTAVFGAVGMLGGMKLAEYLRHRGPLTLRGIGAPVVTVLMVLALLGLSERADVVAHLTGAVVGFVLGLGGPWLTACRQRQAWQWTAFALFCAIVIVAWIAALA